MAALLAVIVGSAAWIWFGSSGSGPGPGSGGPPGAAPGDGGGGSNGGPATPNPGDAGDNSSPDGGGGSLGTAPPNSGGPGQAAAAGGDGGSGSGGIGAPPLPGVPAICGPDDWFGGLKDFIRRLGNPPPNPLKDAVDKSGFVPTDFFGDSVLSPLVGVPSDLLDKGFKQAYGKLADSLPDGSCPGLKGDPHVLTVDGLTYDFQATGEYVALRSEAGDLEVQVRLAPSGDSGRVSRVKAVAIYVDGRVLVVDGDRDPAVTVDGEPLEAPGLVATDGGAYLLRDDSEVGVLWPDMYTSVSVTGIGHEFVNLYTTLDPDRDGTVSGLLGNADGRPDNDLALPDGTVVDDTFDTIYAQYRDAWRVPENESLFSGPSTYDASQPQAPIDISNADRAAARDVCLARGVVVPELLEDCVVDVALTGDAAYADRYGSEQRPRLVLAPGCESGTGDLVATAGGDPGRTFAMDGALIDGALDWEFKPDLSDRAFVRGLALAPDGLLVVDTRNGFEFVDDAGDLGRLVDATPVAHTPTVTTDRVFGLTEVGLVAMTQDGIACWQMVAYPGEKFRTVGLAADRPVATTRIGDVNTVLALDPGTGEVLWSRSFYGAITPPAMTGNVIVFGADTGSVVALNAATGEILWTVETKFGVSSVAISGDTVYTDEISTGVVSRDLGTGDARWTASETSAGVRGTLAVGDNRVVAVGTHALFGIDPVDGTVTWTTPEGESTSFSQPSIAGDVAYTITEGQQLMAYDLATGDELLRLDLPAAARAQGAPLPLGNRLAIFDVNGTLRVYR